MVWSALAATLAKQGLSTIASSLQKGQLNVVKDIASALNTEPTPESIEVAIASDPQAYDKLADVEIKMFNKEEESRVTARNAWVASWFLYFAAGFATLVLIYFGLSIYISAFHEIVSSNMDLYVRNQSTLENVLLIIVGFIFGSSVGSKIKPDIQK